MGARDVQGRLLGIRHLRGERLRVVRLREQQVAGHVDLVEVHRLVELEYDVRIDVDAGEPGRLNPDEQVAPSDVRAPPP